jgi:predicted nuclease of predicted toxin-antitoxin system
LRGKWRAPLNEVPARHALLEDDVPEGLSYLLEQLGHQVTVLRQALPRDAPDEAVLKWAYESGCVLLTCNRDDFLELATKQPHPGIVVVIRRRTRAAKRAALFRLLERAGETGLTNNINFA